MEIDKKWRLILGKEASQDLLPVPLTKEEAGMDAVLEALYDSERKGGLGNSAPSVNRWLGDIRKYFPSSVVQIMQKDAIEKLDLSSLLMEPEMLEGLEADIHLVGTLLSLNRTLPEKTRKTARAVVKKVADELMKKLEGPTKQAIKGSLSRSIKNRRPKLNEVDWHGTIRANLQHYQVDYKTIIPQVIKGFGRKGRASLKDIILCVDQSGSMASSVVYSSIFGAVMASLPTVSTRMVLFDTAIADLTEDLQDPVDLLFGARLGGGTDINRAVAYCQEFIRRPSDTVVVLITDLYEGGNESEMIKRLYQIKESGVQLVVLLALNDEGSPSFDKGNAGKLAALGIPAFACSPDQFPQLVATALKKGDVAKWASREGIVVQ